MMNSTDIDWNDVIKKEVRRIIMKILVKFKMFKVTMFVFKEGLSIKKHIIFQKSE